ncbi:hypothetical protein [Actinocatenispora rupis]|nr:hypothetical protein [Actinocatenispora rupis]
MTGIHRRLTSVPGATGPGGYGRWQYGRGTEELRAAWRSESMATGWSRPRDWWLPEVDELAATLCRAGPGYPSGGVLAASARLGQARADAGVGLTEALDDLAALYRLLPVGAPPLPAVRAFVEAWADVWLRVVHDASCIDPLTELTSAPYLRTRLAELYRAADTEGWSVPDRYRLVVVALDGSGGGWSLLVRRIAVAETLRAVFRGGETMTALAPARIAVLAGHDGGDAVAATLRRILAGRRGVRPARVWLADLPARAGGVAGMLAGLADQADP